MTLVMCSSLTLRRVFPTNCAGAIRISINE
jgi:hypothetical protein